RPLSITQGRPPPGPPRMGFAGPTYGPVTGAIVSNFRTVPGSALAAVPRLTRAMSTAKPAGSASRRIFFTNDHLPGALSSVPAMRWHADGYVQWLRRVAVVGGYYAAQRGGPHGVKNHTTDHGNRRCGRRDGLHRRGARRGVAPAGRPGARSGGFQSCPGRGTRRQPRATSRVRECRGDAGRLAGRGGPQPLVE